MSLKKFFNRLLNDQKLSWSTKKHMSNHVLESYISEDIIGKVSKIFVLGSYRADGKYLNKIMKIIENREYNQICTLNKERDFIEDELGKIPHGDYVNIYSVQWDKENYQLIFELSIAPELPKIIPYKTKVLFNEIVDSPSLNSYKCLEQVYPYK